MTDFNSFFKGVPGHEIEKAAVNPWAVATAAWQKVSPSKKATFVSAAKKRHGKKKVTSEDYANRPPTEFKEHIEAKKALGEDIDAIVRSLEEEEVEKVEKGMAPGTYYPDGKQTAGKGEVGSFVKQPRAGTQGTDYKQADYGQHALYDGEKSGTGMRYPAGQQGSASAGKGEAGSFVKQPRAGEKKVDYQQYDRGQHALKSGLKGNPHEQLEPEIDLPIIVSKGGARDAHLLDWGQGELSDTQIAKGIKEGLLGQQPTRNLALESEYNRMQREYGQDSSEK